MTGAIEGDKDSTWTKLRRRKVVQWGLAYAAGAWGLLQGLQFLAEAFDWSSRVLQFGTLIALIGLPIVLVLAWYHGDRGHQRPLRTEIAILALLLLAGGAGLWVYQRSIETTAASAAKSATTGAPAPSERKTSASVAVLPFSNLSSDPGERLSCRWYRRDPDHPAGTGPEAHGDRQDLRVLVQGPGRSTRATSSSRSGGSA